MIGKQLSPWTMAWFATALTALLVALGLAALGAVGPGNWSGGAALAVVHVFVLGWLGQMMLGALIQFVPVLCARPLVLPGLALPALILGSAGVLMLAVGFLSLDGWPTAGLLTFAPFVLALAFAIVGAMLAWTLIAAHGLRQPGSRLVLLALVALAAVWATGALMALTLRGFDLAPGILPQLLPLHILLGAGGWLTLAAMGVSHKLFAMFLLAPEPDGALPRAIFLVAAIAVAATLGTAPPMFAAIPAMLTVALYLVQMQRLWRSRRRPRPEVNMRWSRAALGFLGLCTLLIPPAIRLGGHWAEAAVFAALAGWLSTLTLAQMVRIVSFLTWIQVFAPRIGRQTVPMVDDLTNARRSGCWLALWSAGVLGGTLSLIAGSAGCFRLAVIAMLIAALGLCIEFIAIRRLRHLPAPMRPATLPPLVLPVPFRSPDHDHTRPAGA